MIKLQKLLCSRSLTLALCLVTSQHSLGHNTQKIQIDLIILAHPFDQKIEASIPFIPDQSKSINLSSAGQKTQSNYQLLPRTQSELEAQYYSLKHHKEYLLLGSYSWRQKANESEKVSLPRTMAGAYEIEGYLSLQTGLYYNFESHLGIKNPRTGQIIPILIKQRLKAKQNYYFDNSHFGLLIRVH